jgi:hypothetical protein
LRTMSRCCLGLWLAATTDAIEGMRDGAEGSRAGPKSSIPCHTHDPGLCSHAQTISFQQCAEFCSDFELYSSTQSQPFHCAHIRSFFRKNLIQRWSSHCAMSGTVLQCVSSEQRSDNVR